MGDRNCERAELVAWATARESDTPEILQRRFIRCRELRIEEAIVTAALYAGVDELDDYGNTPAHIDAARGYLRSFPFPVVEARIRKELTGGNDAESLIRSLVEHLR